MNINFKFKKVLCMSSDTVASISNLTMKTVPTKTQTSLKVNSLKKMPREDRKAGVLGSL